MVVLNTEEESDLTPKDQAESMRGLILLIAGVVVYRLYDGSKKCS